jgi:hypothetical protein
MEFWRITVIDPVSWRCYIRNFGVADVQLWE